MQNIPAEISKHRWEKQWFTDPYTIVSFIWVSLFQMENIFQVWLQNFKNINYYIATQNRSFSITILLHSFHSPSLSFLFLFPLRFPTLSFVHLFHSQYSVFNMSIVLFETHPVSSGNSSSFNRNPYLLFIYAFGTTALCQNFCGCHLS